VYFNFLSVCDRHVQWKYGHRFNHWSLSETYNNCLPAMVFYIAPFLGILKLHWFDGQFSQPNPTLVPQIW
jgi:hypothetical protein